MDSLWVGPPGWGRNGQSFQVVHDTAKSLGIRAGWDKYKAVAKVWDLWKALYCTYPSLEPLSCQVVAQDFRRHCTVSNASWYLVSLECDVDALLQKIPPFVLAMYYGDIPQSINHFSKHAHNKHSNRGGGGGGALQGDEVDKVLSYNGPLSLGRPG